MGRHTEGLTTDGDLLAVGLVDGTVNLLEIVRVGDELVTGDDVLREGVSFGLWGVEGVVVRVFCHRRRVLDSQV